MKRCVNGTRLLTTIALAVLIATAYPSTAAAVERVQPLSADNHPSSYWQRSNVGEPVLAFPTPRYATVNVYASVHSVGDRASQSKLPLAMNVKAFDKAKIGSPDPKDYAGIFGSSLGVVSYVIYWYASIVQMGGGQATLYPVWVPSKDPFYQDHSGAYIIIGKAVLDGTDVYVGTPTDVLMPGEIIDKYVQINVNSTGQLIPPK